MNGAGVKLGAVLIALGALALTIWGAITYASSAGSIFTVGPQAWSWGSAFLAAGFGFWAGLGGLLWLLGTIFFVTEMAGYSLTRRGFAKNGVKWDSIDISTAALCAAVYGGGLVATAPLVIIPGFTWIRPANMLAPIFGMFFGLPGSLGVAIGNFIADALGGFFGFGSIGGFIGNFLLAYIPYRFVGDPSFRSGASALRYYIWAVLVSSLWVAIYIGWWLYVFEPLIGLPPLFVWGWFVPFVFINNGLVTAIVGPFLAYALYPLVKRAGLYWADRIAPPAPSKPA
jgi:energy-coupling factor transport system substrate-specific component